MKFASGLLDYGVLSPSLYDPCGHNRVFASLYSILLCECMYVCVNVCVYMCEYVYDARACMYMCMYVLN